MGYQNQLYPGAVSGELWHSCASLALPKLLRRALALTSCGFAMVRGFT